MRPNRAVMENALFQPYVSTRNAVTIGARTPPILPQRLIHPETEPLKRPPSDMTDDQVALIQKPREPRASVIQKIAASTEAMWDAA